MPKKTPEHIEHEIFSLWTKGEKQQHIATQFNIKQPTVSIICKRIAKKLKRDIKKEKSSQKDKRNREIRELYYHCGWNQIELANQFNLTQPQISRILATSN